MKKKREKKRKEEEKKTRTKQTNKQTNAQVTHRPAPSSPREVITMLTGMKQHEDKEHGKSLKHKRPVV